MLSYDLVFVPHPPISLADLGLTGGPARAVPSDLIVASVTKIIPAQFAEKIVLISIFVLACSGAAALLTASSPRSHGNHVPWLLARLVAGVCYAWNPFVAERLIMGQWALLLGYAGLPWVVREVTTKGARIRAGRLVLAILPAAAGGFAAMSITAVAALPAALATGATWPERARRLALTLAIIAAASLPWIVPSFLVPVHADPNGATAFAARADTSFGTIGSLLMLGGIWNAQAVPAGYGGPASVVWLAAVAVALTGYLVVARPRRICPGLGLAACAGLALAAIGAWRPGLSALRAAIAFWPGFALLRDGQQFIAPLALAESAGLGAAVLAVLAAARPAASVGSQRPAGQGAASRVHVTGPAVVLGVLAMLAPVVLLPGLAWGAVGRLRAVQYPADWRTARNIIEGSATHGSVLLLPWAQYRRYRWNYDEPVYDPWPRLLARPVIWNDALRVGATTVAAESQQARRLTPAINSARSLTAILRAAGVRFVIVDAGPLLGRRQRLASLARLPGARVLLASHDLIVFRLPN